MMSACARERLSTSPRETSSWSVRIFTSGADAFVHFDPHRVATEGLQRRVDEVRRLEARGVLLAPRVGRVLGNHAQARGRRSPIRDSRDRVRSGGGRMQRPKEAPFGTVYLSLDTPSVAHIVKPWHA